MRERCRDQSLRVGEACFLIGTKYDDCDRVADTRIKDDREVTACKIGEAGLGKKKTWNIVDGWVGILYRKAFTRRRNGSCGRLSRCKRNFRSFIHECSRKERNIAC